MRTKCVTAVNKVRMRIKSNLQNNDNNVYNLKGILFSQYAQYT